MASTQVETRRVENADSDQVRPRTRRLALIAAVTGILSLFAGLSNGATAASASLPTTVCGTWAMLQVSKATALKYYAPSIDAALAVPGVKGLSLRAPWTSITTDLGIYDLGVQIAKADHAGLAIRFIAGVATPPQFIGNGATMSGKTIPLPWAKGTTPTSFLPNTVFETAYEATVKQLAAYSRANGIHLLHLTWYGGNAAEIYNGPEVIAAPGYSVQNFLTGYERLVDIGMAVAGPDLTVEFPLSGTGTRAMVNPLEAYMSTKFGSMNPTLVTQFNSLTDLLPAPQPPANGVYVIRQMKGQGDYNWATVYSTLVNQKTQSVEVYLQSFATSLPHATSLRQQVAAFKGC